MPTMYARCNNFMSGATMAAGQTCKYMAIGESEQEVFDQVIEHLGTVHADKVKNPMELENTIRRCIFTKGSKVFGTRGHGD